MMVTSTSSLSPMTVTVMSSMRMRSSSLRSACMVEGALQTRGRSLRKLRRSAHHSVRELEAAIQAWIEAWNDNPRPFLWAKTADEILENLARYLHVINDSGH